MSDSAAIEAIATSLHQHGPLSGQSHPTDRWQDCPRRDAHGGAAEYALAALRAAGFEIYRPDECKQALVEDFNETTGIIDQTVAAAPGRYWLVPVEGEK